MHFRDSMNILKVCEIFSKDYCIAQYLCRVISVGICSHLTLAPQGIKHNTIVKSLVLY